MTLAMAVEEPDHVRAALSVVRDDDPELEDLAEEAIAFGFRGMTPPAPAELPTRLAEAAAFRAELARREAELERPLTVDEVQMVAAIEAARIERERGGASFLEPEDRGLAQLSELGELEYVEDLVRPGRIHLVAGEEGGAKSYAIQGELAIRVAVAGGSFAGTWPVRETGRVLVLSEMHPDDDYVREQRILETLELDRDALRGRYYRLPLMTAAGGPPVLTVDDWRAWVTSWLERQGVVLLVIDTATGASLVDPWGQAIQRVYANLRAMIATYPRLAIVLVVHLRKPQGRGERRISDVLGEWGRWCDVVLMLEADGASRTKLSTFKRVRHQRKIAATRADGLLVDPVDLDETGGTKVPMDAVLAAIADAPGLGYAELGTALGVSKDTAARYVKALGERVDSAATGVRGAVRLFLTTAAPPQTAARAGYGGLASDQTSAEATTAAPPHAYRDAAVVAAVVSHEEVPSRAREDGCDHPSPRMLRPVEGSDDRLDRVCRACDAVLETDLPRCPAWVKSVARRCLAVAGEDGVCRNHLLEGRAS